MRVEATKLLVSATKFGIVLTKKSGNTDQKFSSPNQKFRNADQKYGCLNPHHFLVGLSLAKNEGQPDQNFTLTQPNRNLVVPTLTKGLKRLQNVYECIIR